MNRGAKVRYDLPLLRCLVSWWIGVVRYWVARIGAVWPWVQFAVIVVVREEEEVAALTCHRGELFNPSVFFLRFVVSSHRYLLDVFCSIDYGSFCRTIAMWDRCGVVTCGKQWWFLEELEREEKERITLDRLQKIEGKKSRWNELLDAVRFIGVRIRKFC